MADLQRETTGPGQWQGQCGSGEAEWRHMKEAGGGQTLELMQELVENGGG